MVLMNSVYAKWPDHLVFCCCDYQDTRRAKNVLVPIRCDERFLDVKTTKTCSTCFRECDENTATWCLAHFCAICGELMCNNCFQRVKLEPGERLEQIQLMNQRRPGHWCTKMRADNLPTAQEMTSWKERCYFLYYSHAHVMSLRRSRTKSGILRERLPNQ